MRRILIVIALMLLVGCLIGNCRRGGTDGGVGSDGVGTKAYSSAVYDSASCDSASCDSASCDTLMPTESLNDIRFANFTEEDWFDNEYIRTLRAYLDAFVRGEVEDEQLAPYRYVVKGRFMIFDVNDFIGGGLFIQFVFVDHPEHLFVANVYSTVDMEQRQVVDYAVQYVDVRENVLDMTKEELRDSLKLHPKWKQW